jgi:hypothetical protein
VTVFTDVAYPWKANPALWCGDTIAGLTSWCADQVAGDLQKDAYPEVRDLRRAVSTSIARDDGQGHEVWWNGVLFLRPGPAQMGRTRFEGVLVSRFIAAGASHDDDPPYSPVRTVMRGCASTKTDSSGATVDRLHSWLQLEGVAFDPAWAEGVTLDPAHGKGDSQHPTAWSSVSTAFADNSGDGYSWWVEFTPGYACLPPQSMRSGPPYM